MDVEQRRRKERTHVSMNDGRLSKMKVLETLGDVEHEFELRRRREGMSELGTFRAKERRDRELTTTLRGGAGTFRM